MLTVVTSPSVVVGVVCVAHSVEVELLEQLDVSQHGLLRDGFAPSVLVHVAVHALDHDGHVVVQQLATLDFILAKAHLIHTDTVASRYCSSTAACMLVIVLTSAEVSLCECLRKCNSLCLQEAC